MFLILKWRRLHSKNSAWLSDSSTCVAWNQSKFIDNWVRHVVMALWTWKMCVRGCDSSKKAERRVTWCVQVVRSPNLLTKTTHHRKLKMQEFLNVITLYFSQRSRHDCMAAANASLGDLRTWTHHVYQLQCNAVWNTYNYWPFLGPFAKFWKASICFVMPVRVKQLGSHWTDFSWNFLFEYSWKMFEKKQVSLKLDKNNRYFGWLQIYLFDHISLVSSLNDKYFKKKSCTENQNTHFLFGKFFSKTGPLWDSVEKYCRAGQTTVDNIAHAYYMLDT